MKLLIWLTFLHNAAVFKVLKKKRNGGLSSNFSKSLLKLKPPLETVFSILIYSQSDTMNYNSTVLAPFFGAAVRAHGFFPNFRLQLHKNGMVLDFAI